ncbi:hypothetical protein GCM10011384_24620 [Psychrobacillus lasiicapitis]|nr:hypothetical protein GCM10011384_24620 [Psychrobacillus lasiicapitis]
MRATSSSLKATKLSLNELTWSETTGIVSGFYKRCANVAYRCEYG